MSRAVPFTESPRRARTARRHPVRFQRRGFGRRRAFIVAPQPMAKAVSDDLRLFASTFAAGFLFISVLIG